MSLMLADRIRQRGDLAQTFGHGRDAGIGQLEPIEQGGIEAFGAPGLQIQFVRLFEVPGFILNQICNRPQGTVFHPGISPGNDARRRERLCTQLLHVVFYVHLQNFSFGGHGV